MVTLRQIAPLVGELQIPILMTSAAAHRPLVVDVAVRTKVPEIAPANRTASLLFLPQPSTPPRGDLRDPRPTPAGRILRLPLPPALPTVRVPMRLARPIARKPAAWTQPSAYVRRVQTLPQKPLLAARSSHAPQHKRKKVLGGDAVRAQAIAMPGPRP